MRITKIISTAIIKSRLIIKVLGLGSKDIQTVYNIAPFGIDSNPVSGLRGIWAQTESYEDRILLGVLFEKAIAAVGETRVYSTDADGNVVIAMHLKSNGTVEIGGNSDNAVRYSKLNDGLQNMKSDINTELVKIQVAISGLGGSYVNTPISLNINDSKINNIKTS